MSAETIAGGSLRQGRLSIVPDSEAHWKQMRAEDVTSTESPALFGLSPYMTHLELFHRKKNRDITDIQINDRMLWGKRMEALIAQGIGEDNGVLVRPVMEYSRIVGSKMGASFDFEIYEALDRGEASLSDLSVLQRMFADYGPGLFEIKATGYIEFRDNWTKHDDKTIEAPGHIEIQLQHQLHVADKYQWGAVGVLVAGNTAKLTARLRDKEVGEALETGICRLWDDIDAGRVPAASYPRDADLIKSLNSKIAEGTIFDGRGNPEFAKLLIAYSEAGGREKAAKEAKDSAGAAIVDIMKGAERAISDEFNVSRWTVAETLVEAYVKKGFSSMKITRKKAK